MSTCEYDTGTRFGNLPACSKPATVTASYRNGSFGPFITHLCRAHVAAMSARVYPSPLAISAGATR